MTEVSVGKTPVDQPLVAARFCFICGARMNETWRASQNGGCYIWYECSRDGCDQTYLIREHTQDGPVFNELTCRV